MSLYILNILARQLGGSPPTIRNIVTPISHNEGELVRSKMTRKLDEDKATEEVRRAVNAWMYEG